MEESTAAKVINTLADGIEEQDDTDQLLPADVFALVAQYLIRLRKFRTCANLNETSHAIYDTTLPVLWKTVWIGKEKMQGMMVALRKKGKGVKHVQYIIHPDPTGDPQGLCIAAINRALNPKACLAGPVPLGGGTYGATVSRIIVHLFDGFYKHGSADLVDLWEAMGLLRRHLPVKNDNDGLNINVVVQMHSQQVKEEWKVPHKPVKVRLPNLDPLRFQKFDFYHNATLVESPRLTAFLTDVGTIQGKQSAISKVSSERPPRIPGYNVEAMWSHYDAEMRFFGCNQQNMGIILPALERSFKTSRHNVLGAVEISFRPNPTLPAQGLTSLVNTYLTSLAPTFAAGFDQQWLLRPLVISRGVTITVEPEKRVVGVLKFTTGAKIRALVSVTEGGRVVHQKFFGDGAAVATGSKWGYGS